MDAWDAAHAHVAGKAPLRGLPAIRCDHATWLSQTGVTVTVLKTAGALAPAGLKGGDRQLYCRA